MKSFVAYFSNFTTFIARMSGHPALSFLALLSIIIWLFLGPLFKYSPGWQLVINTTTTIITFIMVFLIQNTQYRDIQSIHVKLDELIRAQSGAHNILLDLEGLSQEQIDAVKKKYAHLALEARQEILKGHSDTLCPGIDPTLKD
jgi:low affinity Fe/Cu permease